MKFCVGDIVKIKEGLNHENTHGFVDDMKEYCGKVARVTEINKNAYSLDIDNGLWYWSDDMLEPVHKEYHIIVDGTTVIIRDNNGNECKVEGDIAKSISIALENMKWKPKNGEDYWTVDLFSDTNTIKFEWDNDRQDNEIYRKGLVFRTEDEAKRTADKMLKAIKS